MAKLDVLEERVGSHIRFFYAIAGIFAVWLGALSFALYQMNGSINALRLPQKLEQSSLHPESKLNQDRASSLLNQARLSSIGIPESIVQSAGARFIEASAHSPGAWSAALNFLSFHSSLVYVREVKTVGAPPVGTTFRYDIGPRVDDAPLPQVSFMQTPVSPADSARLETMGKNLNQGMNVGPAELFLTGGSFSLDNKYIKHVILSGVDVHYTGKPVMIQDVIFVHCRFEMDNTNPARKLGKEILASSSSVTFTHPS